MRTKKKETDISRDRKKRCQICKEIGRIDGTLKKREQDKNTKYGKRRRKERSSKSSERERER